MEQDERLAGAVDLVVEVQAIEVDVLSGARGLALSNQWSRRHSFRRRGAFTDQTTEGPGSHLCPARGQDATGFLE